MSYIVSPTAIFCSFALSVCYALQPQELTSETSMAWTHRNPVTLHDLSHAAEQRTRLGYHLQGVVLDIREILALGEMNVKGLIHVHTCMEMRHFQNATTVRTRRSKMAQFLLFCRTFFLFFKSQKRTWGQFRHIQQLFWSRRKWNYIWADSAHNTVYEASPVAPVPGDSYHTCHVVQ